MNHPTDERRCIESKNGPKTAADDLREAIGIAKGLALGVIVWLAVIACICLGWRF